MLSGFGSRRPLVSEDIASHQTARLHVHAHPFPPAGADGVTTAAMRATP